MSWTNYIPHRTKNKKKFPFLKITQLQTVPIYQRNAVNLSTNGEKKRIPVYMTTKER